jgi:hypothetical protein
LPPTVVSGCSSPAARRCSRAIQLYSDSARSTGAKSASPTIIGALWAEGVVAEIVLFWQSAPLVARMGPLGLMALGGIAGICAGA